MSAPRVGFDDHVHSFGAKERLSLAEIYPPDAPPHPERSVACDALMASAPGVVTWAVNGPRLHDALAISSAIASPPVPPSIHYVVQLSLESRYASPCQLCPSPPHGRHACVSSCAAPASREWPPRPSPSASRLCTSGSTLAYTPAFGRAYRRCERRTGDARRLRPLPFGTRALGRAR